jgi:hypothetical protein
MTRKATAKKPATKPKPKSKTASKSKSAKKAKTPAKPKSVTAYVVRRRVPAEGESYTEPERVFATKAAAQKLTDERNAELRAMVNPFERYPPQYVITGGENAFLALLKKLRLTPPKKPKSDRMWINWEGWWDDSYFDMTDVQREAIWDALDRFDWYQVATTTVE